MRLTINTEFELEQIVYLKTDVDQKRRVVTEIIITEKDTMYTLMSSSDESRHYGFEITKEKTVF